MPRTFRHWTPRYIVNRLALAYQQRVSPFEPWLTKTACAFLDDWLKPTDIGFEWGCGRSTLWFAARVKRLTSIEHNAEWYNRVRLGLTAENRLNVDLRLIPTGSNCRGANDSYVSIARDFENESLDFVLVDGQFRSQCAQAAVPLVKPGGILIIDNANWFIPHDTFSPGAATQAGGAATSEWKPALSELRNWRLVWTSNGVTDTAIYCKPAQCATST